MLKKASRWVDGRCSAILMRRRTTPSARCARRLRSSARFSKSTLETPAEAAPEAFRTDRLLDSGKWWSTQRVKCSATRPISPPEVQEATEEPGSILITAAVHPQTAGLFVAEERGQHELKGLSAPMSLYRVVRASGGGRRGGAPRALTPLVGREEELDLLARRWQRPAQQGGGQLALIVGEPGLGKSRLMMEEFHGRLGETPHTWVRVVVVAAVAERPRRCQSPNGGASGFRRGPHPPRQRLADPPERSGTRGTGPNRIRASARAAEVDVLLPEDRAEGEESAPEEVRLAPATAPGDDRMDLWRPREHSRSCSPSRTCTRRSSPTST